MINAYILIVMQPGFSNDAIDKIIKINEVIKTSVIAGNYDLIIRVSINDLHQLHTVIQNIQRIKGIKKTVTSLIEKELFV